jgi:hypothetical protein
MPILPDLCRLDSDRMANAELIQDGQTNADQCEFVPGTLKKRLATEKTIDQLL